MDEDVKKIFVTGWSAGAAIGLIASEDINFHFGIKPTFIGYAGARPCANKHTRDFVQNVLADDSISFVFGMDIVVRVPPVYSTMDDIIYYLEVKENIFQKFISLFRTEYWHTNVDLGIKEYLV